MPSPKEPVRISLTEDQKAQIRRQTGKDAEAVEFSLRSSRIGSRRWPSRCRPPSRNRFGPDQSARCGRSDGYSKEKVCRCLNQGDANHRRRVPDLPHRALWSVRTDYGCVAATGLANARSDPRAPQPRTSTASRPYRVWRANLGLLVFVRLMRTGSLGLGIWTPPEGTARLLVNC